MEHNYYNDNDYNVHGVTVNWLHGVNGKKMLRRTILLTFLKRFDPRIDLAQFFGPPGVGLSYHQGHSCGPPWQPLAPSRLWTGLPSVSDLPLRIGICGPFLQVEHTHTFSQNFSNCKLHASKKKVTAVRNLCYTTRIWLNFWYFLQKRFPIT